MVVEFKNDDLEEFYRTGYSKKYREVPVNVKKKIPIYRKDFNKS